MNKEGYINEAEKNILHTYNRFSLVLDHGEGVYLYDTDGKEYLDFAAGIAVQAFGYGNKEYGDALKAQIDKIMHTSNLYYNVPIIHAAERVKKSEQDGSCVLYQQWYRGNRRCNQGSKNTLTETDMQDMRSLQ